MRQKKGKRVTSTHDVDTMRLIEAAALAYRISTSAVIATVVYQLREKIPKVLEAYFGDGARRMQVVLDSAALDAESAGKGH